MSHFVEKIIALEENNQIGLATATLYEEIDKLLREDKFDTVDDYIAEFNDLINQITTFLARSILSITFAAKSKLKNRSTFWENCINREDWFRSGRGQKLFGGLK
jgi:Cdc6-like AAA superfamily ATPase